MSANTITLTLPEKLHRRLEIISRMTSRPVADILVACTELIVSAESVDVVVTPELADKLATLYAFGNRTLGAAEVEKLAHMEKAVHDDGFMADVSKVRNAFVPSETD